MRLLLIIALLFVSGNAWSAERIALVIGIAEYRSIPPLKNTVNDASDLSAALSKIGFDVTTLINVGGRELRENLDKFAFRSETADLALIYFAGHGVEVQGENFLIPADAEVRSNRDIQKQAVSLKDFLRTVDQARKMRIVILDSCRNNPFGDFLDLSEPVQTAGADTLQTRGGGGLAPPTPDRGTLVAFAARDGSVALDGDGSNSPFALALIDKLSRRDLEISLMFRQVRDDVLQRTRNLQEPHTYGSLSGIPFFLAGGGGQSTAEDAGNQALAWSAIRPEAEQQFRALAQEGDTRALLGLALMRLHPSSERFDPEQAVKYLEQAVALGSAEAQYELARQFEMGIGVSRDEARALELFQQAARQDYPDALNDLGFLHYQGMLGLPPDPQRALIYFERAADLRHPQAMYNFGALIDDGLVPGKTPDDAAAYIYQALRAGNPEVFQVLKDHPDNLEPETRRALQRRLQEFNFYSGSIDGDFGPGTQRGIRAAFGLTE